jgi:nitrogen fixation protein FixH
VKQTLSRPKEFTGRHMLAIMLLFFGTIIAVNLVLATYSQTSWTGLVVENSYVASQEFNGKIAEGRAQLAHGWRGQLDFQPGKVSYRLQDRAGSPIAVMGVKITFRRPSYEAEDVTMAMQRQADGIFGLTTDLRDGIWIVETSAGFDSGPPYRGRRRVVLKGGVAQ